MTPFENSLPEVFFKKMSKEVITVGKTYEKSAKKNFAILDTDIILTRVLYLLNRDVELKNIFHYELAPMPTSLFNTNLMVALSFTMCTSQLDPVFKNLQKVCSYRSTKNLKLGMSILYLTSTRTSALYQTQDNQEYLQSENHM